MGTFIGIDGIRGGWVAVYIDKKGRQRFDYSCRLDRLLAVSHDRAMIDVPIGLPERGYRRCDLDAKKLIGSSVFLGARWNVWTFRTYEEANAVGSENPIHWIRERRRIRT
jgi:predicted RNase H-like nuclease